MSDAESPRIIPLAEHPQLAAAIPEYALDRPLGLDTKRLARLTLLGCLDPNVQFRVKSGEASTFDTKIVGRIGNMAVGGASGMSRARLSQSEYDAEESGEIHSLARVTVDINSTALQERAQAHGNVRDGKGWARQLNRAVVEGAESAAWSHLVRHIGKGEAFDSGFQGLGYTAYNALFGDLPTSLEEVPASVATFQLLRAVLLSFKGNQVPFKQRCWSFIPVVHPDRALMVSGFARTLPVIRPLRQKELLKA